MSSTGLSKNAPQRDYSLESSESARTFSAFTSISIIAAIFGNGILPEIQVINLSNLMLQLLKTTSELSNYLLIE